MTSPSIIRARALRKRLTSQEVKLWVHLRALKPQGLHFRRQFPICGYIGDFACKSAMLIVEADGNQHGQTEIRLADAKRDRRLHDAGYKVLRFSNFDIDLDVQSVVETIFHEAMARLKQ